MHKAVPSQHDRPLIRLDGQRLTHVAVDVAHTKLHESVHVLYVATLEGSILKYSVLPRTREACLVEVIEPFQHDDSSRILTMQFLKAQVCTSPPPAFTMFTFDLGFRFFGTCSNSTLA